MKIAILFLCALCIVSYEEVGAQDASILQRSCLEKQGIAMSELSSLIADDSEEGHRKRGCLEVCYFERIGLVKDDKIYLDGINSIFTKVMPPGEKTEIMRQHINQCAATATSAGGDDFCIVVDLFTQCGLEEFKLNIRTLMHQMT
ncbi:uncharacterized protein LOC143210208 [Lasioglossum baleicum]|uniref:uncharacterized protein LOC143210208 n=1 Tax=Lasioglossum baleicum TaxID=434251 RepID=UPI003FCD13D4